MRFMLAVAVILPLCGIAAFAQEPLAGQKGQAKTDSKMAYHHGPIVTGVPEVYFIWYGTWDNNADNTAVQFILTDFLSNLGGSPYFQINAMYANGIGGAPSGALFYSGAAIDRYSHGRFRGSFAANSQSKPGSGRNGIDVGAIAKQSDN